MKKVLYVILAIVVLYLILAVAGPSHVKIEKKITINKPVEMVKRYTTDYKFFHDKWSPWTELDPNMTNNYIGTPGQIGHKYEWSGNNKVSTGSMEIVAMNGDSVNQVLAFEKRGTSKTYYIESNNNGATDFTWGLEMDVPFMFRPFMLFTDMGMNERFQKGLDMLKKVMEEMPSEAMAKHFDIRETNWEEVTYLGKKGTMSFDSIPVFLGKHFRNLYGDLQHGKINSPSAPSGIYTAYDKDNRLVELTAAAKVPKDTRIKGWEVYTFPPSKVLHVEYYGDYAKMEEAHEAINAYMKEKGFKELAIIEEYVTDPMVEKDTAKWMSNIYYILK